ncbi:neuroligin-2-like [Schistocerca nitens]|uniref:neuroligin-2-like n=1 Tax=Schistocerca nitens TaxID=7011 RepID=UPI0021192071|nr:neuroligin-2-like [Schistocerca nitens]
MRAGSRSSLLQLLALLLWQLSGPAGGVPAPGGVVGGGGVGVGVGGGPLPVLGVGQAPVMSTRIVQTRYGKLQGLVLPMEHARHLRPVEVFLGIPYATPPVRSNRFSPTRTPSPWEGVRIADTLGPVCPQKLPDISNETAALERMPKGRLEYLKRLLPHLKNQSEDCLYLNIYAPVQGKGPSTAING